MFYFDGGKFAVLGVLIDGFLSRLKDGSQITHKLLMVNNVKKQINNPKPLKGM